MEVSLTFDDGPQPRWTAEVLDALAGAGARATFFVLAAKAVREPGLVERTLAEGHEVQLHGNHHLRHTEHDRDTIERDTDAALARLDVLGVRPSLWRLPWGTRRVVDAGDRRRPRSADRRVGRGHARLAG